MDVEYWSLLAVMVAAMVGLTATLTQTGKS